MSELHQFWTSFEYDTLLKTGCFHPWCKSGEASTQLGLTEITILNLWTKHERIVFCTAPQQEMYSTLPADT
jgi:hypothetical protein